MWLKIHEIRIGTRLAVAFAVVLALLAGMAAFSASQSAKLARNTDYYASNIVPSVDLMRKIVVAVEDVRRFELQHVLADDIASSTEAEEGIAAARKRLEQGLGAYGAFSSDAEESLIVDRVKAAIAAYLGNWEQLQRLSQQGEEDAAKAREANRLFRESAKAFETVHRAAADWGAYKEAVSLRYKENSGRVFRSSMVWLAAFFALALLIGIASAAIITRSIARPLGKALGVARTVASGDLTARVEPRGHDELAELLRALDHMNRRLVAVVSGVRTASESVAESSHEIASGNAELSERTERQASNLEETSASMEELAATVRRNAEMSEQASSLAQEAAAAARRGGDSMGEVVASIRQISGTSHRIAEIISVVDGIAFQTNILALNAAVEAARAGEQGRGFAVVASEVRALAQRSADAAKDIKNLIDGSVSEVDKGMRKVAQTGEAVGEIVDQVQRVSDLLAEISGSSREQTQSIAHVSQAVAQLDQVTQQNAALVQESAASAERLRHQAGKLVEEVSVFRLESAGAGPVPANAGQDRPVRTVAGLLVSPA